jgi:hypothetical protein
MRRSSPHQEWTAVKPTLPSRTYLNAVGRADRNVTIDNIAREGAAGRTVEAAQGPGAGLFGGTDDAGDVRLGDCGAAPNSADQFVRSGNFTAADGRVLQQRCGLPHFHRSDGPDGAAIGEGHPKAGW